MQILQQCDAARADFLGETNAQSSVRVAVLDTLSQEVIVNTFGVLARREPNRQIEIWEGSAARVAKWLAQGRVDFAWTNVNDLTPTARVLWREPLVAVVARNHPFAKLGGQITLRDLEAYPFVHRSRCELDAVGRAQLKAAGVKLQVTARAEREDLAYRLIRNSKALTLAPKSLVPQDLVALTVSDLSVARIIGLQWREKVDASLLTTISDACAEAMQTMERASINAKQRTSKKPRAKRA